MTAISWPGTTEQRDQRRGLNVGRAYWHNVGDEHRPGWIHDALRMRTPKRDRWIWAARFADDKRPVVEQARGQHWGLDMLDRWAAGKMLEWWAPMVAAAEALDEWAEAWLWCEECLEHDGWTKTSETVDGQRATAWTKSR